MSSLACRAGRTPASSAARACPRRAAGSAPAPPRSACPPPAPRPSLRQPEGSGATLRPAQRRRALHARRGRPPGGRLSAVRPAAFSRSSAPSPAPSPPPPPPPPLQPLPPSLPPNPAPPRPPARRRRRLAGRSLGTGLGQLCRNTRPAPPPVAGSTGLGSFAAARGGSRETARASARSGPAGKSPDGRLGGEASASGTTVRARRLAGLAGHARSAVGRAPSSPGMPATAQCLTGPALTGPALMATSTSACAPALALQSCLASADHPCGLSCAGFITQFTSTCPSWRRSRAFPVYPGRCRGVVLCKILESRQSSATHRFAHTVTSPSPRALVV